MKSVSIALGLLSCVASIQALAEQRTQIYDRVIDCVSSGGKVSISVTPTAPKVDVWNVTINGEELEGLTGGYMFNTGDSVITFAQGSLLVDYVGEKLVGELTYKGKTSTAMACSYTPFKG
jgi:hypothetical protein